MRNLIFSSLVALGLSLTLNENVQAQCTFNVSLSPENPILCPNSSSELEVSGADFDSLRWFKWLGYNWDPVQEVVTGINQTTLPVNSFNDAAYLFWVEAWKDGCMERSDTQLVDGWAFLPPVVMTEYIGEPDDQGNYLLGCGDTATLTLLSPYSTNIVWYRNGNVIPGETGNTLRIEESGAYTVSGAPEVCPDFINQLGVEVSFEVLEIPPFEIIQNDNELSVSEGISWQWYYNGSLSLGATDSILNTALSGTYSVEVNFGNGCVLMSAPITIDFTGIPQHSALEALLYPNPAKDWVQLPSMENPWLNAEILDFSGRRLEALEAPAKGVSVGHLPAGLYFIRLRDSGQNTYLYKMVKI